jgi:hypothetical protein
MVLGPELVTKQRAAKGDMAPVAAAGAGAAAAPPQAPRVVVRALAVVDAAAALAVPDAAALAAALAIVKAAGYNVGPAPPAPETRRGYQTLSEEVTAAAAGEMGADGVARGAEGEQEDKKKRKRRTKACPHTTRS